MILKRIGNGWSTRFSKGSTEDYCQNDATNALARDSKRIVTKIVEGLSKGLTATYCLKECQIDWHKIANMVGIGLSNGLPKGGSMDYRKNCQKACERTAHKIVKPMDNGLPHGLPKGLATGL